MALTFGFPKGERARVLDSASREFFAAKCFGFAWRVGWAKAEICKADADATEEEASRCRSDEGT